MIYPTPIINSILQQSISDFEIILPKKYSKLKKDNRIKINTKAIGHHLLEIKSIQNGYIKIDIIYRNQ